MALAATVIWNINTAGASDTLSGGFDYSATTAGAYTDLHCTLGTGNTPNVTSASYNFISTDVNHWIYINSGTNWIPGWYQIASVGSNAANINATVSSARMAYNQTSGVYAGANGSLNTTAGCSSTATNTNGATWTIDRSWSTSAFATGSAGTIATTNLTPGTGYTAGKQDVGNNVYLVSATGATAGWYNIRSISGSAWVLDRAPGGSGTNATWNLGGGFSTIGGFGTAFVATNTGTNQQRCFLTGNQSLTNTTANTSGGPLSIGSFGFEFQGYQTVAGDLGAMPFINPGAQTGVTLISSAAANGNPLVIKKLWLDGLNAATTNGLNCTGVGVELEDVFFTNFAASGTTYGITGDGAVCRRCYAYNCGLGFTSVFPDLCEADTCTTGFTLVATCIVNRCISRGCSGSGFSAGTNRLCVFEGCTSYNNTLSGIDVSGGIGNRVSNSIVYGNGAFGVKTGGVYDRLLNVASGSNTSGRTQTGASSGFDPLAFQILLTADPFQNLNGGVTQTNGTNLTVNGSNNLIVTPDGYTTTASDVGLKLVILCGSGWAQGVYTITAASGGTWTLNNSPAATSQTSGIWRLSDFTPNNVSGGGSLLIGQGHGNPTQRAG